MAVHLTFNKSKKISWEQEREIRRALLLERQDPEIIKAKWGINARQLSLICGGALGSFTGEKPRKPKHRK